MAQLTISDQLAERLAEYLHQTNQTLESTLEVMVSGLSLANPTILALITHDMRTPLASIMTSSDLIRMHQGVMTPEQSKEHLDTIQMQVTVINDMIDNLIVIQKYEQGSLFCDCQINSLTASVLGAIGEINQRTYNSHQIIFAADQPTINAYFDNKLLRLAIMHILTNAVRYSSENSRITITCTQQENQALVEITDEGIGLPDTESSQITELFFRASNVRHIPGKGLGLAVVKRILALHSGSLKFSTPEQGGLCVTLGIPTIN